MIVYVISKVFQAPVNDSYSMLEELIVSLVGGYDLFPFPLININLMDIVEFLITPDSIHIRITPASLLYSVSPVRHSLPLRK